MAITARIGDHRARAFTCRAGLLNGEESLLHADLTSAAAGRAFHGLRPFFSAAAIAFFAGHLGRYLDRDRVAADCLFEIQPEFIAEISTTKYLASTAAAAAENIAKDIAENVAEALSTESAAWRDAPDTVMTKLVVRCTLVGIAQYFVRFFCLFEFAFGVAVFRAAIGMVFHGQASIRLFDLVVRCILLETKNFVVVAFGHSSYYF